jgi:EAL domain-containing protein (putative c-di-GMP-specific phosphodiesterase class I)
MAQKRLSDDILLGLERDEFTCVYQPQFDARTGRVTGVEALVRWQAKGCDPVFPADFMAMADEMDVLEAIDRIVLAKAAQDFARWESEGLDLPRLSVNLSKARLRNPDLPRELAKIGMPPDRLSFELLESNYLDDQSDVVAANLRAIRALGISIEVDDFGTGHASIVSLLKLRPNRFKIDRALVEPIARSDLQAQLVKSIVEIGHLLGIGIIAEGVETTDQRDLLVAMGCDELQGYALARPLTSEEVPAFLKAASKGNSGQIAAS